MTNNQEMRRMPKYLLPATCKQKVTRELRYHIDIINHHIFKILLRLQLRSVLTSLMRSVQTRRMRSVPTSVMKTVPTANIVVVIIESTPEKEVISNTLSAVLIIGQKLSTSQLTSNPRSSLGLCRPKKLQRISKLVSD